MEVKKKLLDIVRGKIRFKHYIFYHNKKHPIDIGKPEIEAFLIHIVAKMNKGKVASPLDM